MIPPWSFTSLFSVCPVVDAKLNAMIEKDKHKAGDWHNTDNKAGQKRLVEWRDRNLSSFKSFQVNPFKWRG